MEPSDTPIEQTSDGRLLPRRGHLLALAVLIGSITFVFVMWRVAYDRELRAGEAQFVRRTTEVADLLRQRMINYELVARGGAALFASVQRPTPQQWYGYVDGMDIRNRFPAMVGFGFAGYVRQERLEDLQLEWRQAGYGLLEVYPHAWRSHYGPILYLEPKSPENVRAVGFDMYSEPTRHAAMALALETGRAQLSGPVQLVQDGTVQTTGLLLYLPVYRGGERPATVEARQESMQGWVYMPFRMQPLVEYALHGTYPNLRFRIRDVTRGGEGELLYSNIDDAGPAPEPTFHYRIFIEQYGRRWQMDFQSPPLGSAVPRLQGLRNTLALGLFASLLMYALAWSLARTEGRAHKLALRMTEDFRRSEMRFRTAMNYSAIGKVLLDSEGAIVEANPALGAIVGRSPESLVGVRFDSLFEDDEPTASEYYPRGQTDELGIHRVTRRLHREGGEPRHVQLTFSPVPGNVGQDIVGLVQLEDVTERLRVEARVHALNRTLEARVALRTRELSQANQELEAFAYSVSHDLRAPLRSIEGFSRVLLERHAGQLDAAGQDYLNRVRRAAARMGELIDALLKMSRLTRGELRIERVNLSRMAAELVEELRGSDPGREVQVEIAPELYAEGDAALLRNLLANLLGNAWKFTRGREGARIEFGAQPSGGGGDEYFVRDNGAGFQQEYVDKLFRPFQRLHSQGEFAGHGIGLASVKRIVQRHGGSLRAEGREGAGATFYFTLPDHDRH